MTTALQVTSKLDELKDFVRKSSDLKEVLKRTGELFAPSTTTPPAKLPVITDEQHNALVRLVSVFGKVAPVSRRELTKSEIADLITERLVIDQILKLTEGRKDAIRTIIFNHLDVQADNAGVVPAHRDKNGFYILAGEARAEGQSNVFKRSARDGTAHFDAGALKDLEDRGVISHEEYLGATTQTRVINEDATLALLKSRPELVEEFGKVVTYQGRSAVLTVPKA